MKNKIVLVIAIILVVFIIVVALNNTRTDNSLSDTNTNEEQSNNFYVTEGAIYEKTGDINQNAILSNTEKINRTYQQYLQNMNVYFTIIPDKTYYLEDKMNSDFTELVDIVNNNLDGNIQYFDISSVLKIEDYYKTDMHWKQENLDNVVDVIEQEMEIENGNFEEEPDYEEKTLGDFYGTYYKEQKENKIEPDELKYLTNEEIEKSTVYNAETELNEPVYNISKAEETGNLYDVFLSGASAIEIIKNEQAENGKRLILFRDSFASSIVPLLINDYEEIVLIDLRYVNYTILSNYVDFANYEKQDVLFLYSTRVINKSGIFR